MTTDECRGNQQLDADEQKEEPSLMLSGMLGEVESVRGQQEREHGEDKQQDSHVLMPHSKIVFSRRGEVNQKSYGWQELKPIDAMEPAHLCWKLNHQMVQELQTALRL